MTSISYDYIIVGAGSAGCIVAGRLARETNKRILLLEAGSPAEDNPDTLSSDGFKYCFANDNVMWDRFSSKQPNCNNRRMYAGTGTGMGGSGSVNGMVYTRGDKRDFAEWPKGWHWEDVALVFDALENQLDIRHREGTAFTERALEGIETQGFTRKHALNDGDLGGFMGYNTMNYQGETRRSSYVSFLKGESLPNLTIVTGACVHKILINNKQATGIRYEYKGAILQADAVCEIILSAGALETPKLLMLSGIGPADHLKDKGIEVVLDQPAIGQNLQDHTNVCLFFKGNKPIDFNYPQVYGFGRMNPRLDLAEGQPDTCLTLLSAPITLKQSMYRMVPATILHPKLFKLKPLRWLIKQCIDGFFSLPFISRYVDQMYGIVVILGKPESKGQLRLASNNPTDQADINPAYFENNLDLETLYQGVLKAKAIANTPQLTAWGSKPVIPATASDNPDTLKKWIKRAAMTTFHFCGTCKMGDDNASPINTDLSLKGITGLRIADTSIIPNIPVSAINAPSMMIGYRAADFIINKL
ncbi:MAG: GMC family oxidoreductase N-terminal domain-containing protein [Cellvibrionales bacterium]|nr:GMC family oxidoreductase N-terminal domain-containing protein [Cellvibrionales bacterium]